MSVKGKLKGTSQKADKQELSRQIDELQRQFRISEDNNVEKDRTIERLKEELKTANAMVDLMGDIVEDGRKDREREYASVYERCFKVLEKII